MGKKRDHTSKSTRKGFWRSRKFKVILVIVGVLVIARIILPYVVLHYANKTLESLPGYYGHVNDIDIRLYRGAYVIDSIYLNKKDSLTDEQTKFFSSEVIDLAIEWKALFKGEIVGTMDFDHPELIFTKDKVEPKQLEEDSTSFRVLLDKFMPLRVNRFEVNEGVLQYIDSTSSPMVNIQMNQAHILAENLTNVADTSLLPSKVQAQARVYGGSLDFNMQLNLLAERPTFDMDAELKGTHLPELNEFFQAYANIDVNKGVFGLYTEVASEQGKYEGYVKPVIQDLDILGREDKKDNLLRKAWEALVGLVGNVLTNPEEDQVATKIPLKGDVNEASADIWSAVLGLLRNAFIQAIVPSIDYEINIQSVEAEEEQKKGVFKDLFEKDADKKEERKERREKKREERRNNDNEEDNKE